MKLVLSITASLVLSSLSFAADSGKAPQPGQLASGGIAAPQSSDIDSSSNSVIPATSIANVEDAHDRLMNRLWIASIVAAAAGTTLDAASSWGKMESNSFLASGNGTFGVKGAAIKGAFAAAVIVPQICLRKHKQYRSAFTIGNFGEASIFSAAAIHNMGIPKAH